MKRTALLLALAASTVSVLAQAPAPKPATAAAKPATGAAKRPAVAASSAIKLPPGVAPVRGPLKTAFALKYQDFKIGTGALAEPGKLYKVHYTGWLASDGKKFDSSFDHRKPVLDKDGKPENDADGKPKLGDPEPIQFPQGRRGVIPGWDQGFEGMKVGGKRRLFIPYQLAYGATGRPPVIPAKADLIFDIELLDVTDMPTSPMGGMGPGGRPMPQRPGMPGGPGGPRPGAAPGTLGVPPTPPAASGKPADPTKPTVAPNSDKPAVTPAPATPPPPPAAAPTAAPDKPANPAQPN